MATYNINQYESGIGAAPYGNLATFRFHVETGSTGALVSAKDAKPLKQNDIVHIGKLPNGFVIETIEAVVESGNIGTLKLGYESGADVNHEKFGDIDLSSVGRKQPSTHNVLRLKEDASLILKLNSDVSTSASVVFIVHGEVLGNK